MLIDLVRNMVLLADMGIMDAESEDATEVMTKWLARLELGILRHYRHKCICLDMSAA